MRFRSIINDVKLRLIQPGNFYEDGCGGLLLGKKGMILGRGKSHQIMISMRKMIPRNQW